MVKKVINVGVEGNDATGDSIRDSFVKTNENFTELYAAFGLGGGISFTSLEDTPEELTPNTVFIVNDAGTQLVAKTLSAGEGINIDITNPTQIIIENTGSRVVNDTLPSLGNTLNASGLGIGNLSNPNSLEAAALGVSIDSFAINKGYADSRYLNVTGDTATGPISVPAGATGTQVPRKQEVVGRAGGVDNQMTGPLLLSVDPNENSNPLTAATKNYVDTSSFSSQINLYVSTNGTDYRWDVPEARRGRALAYAFRTVSRACQKAEEILAASPIGLGPYQKPIFRGDGETRSTVSAVTLISGDIYNLDITHNGAGTDPRSGAIPDIRAGLLIKGASSGAIARIEELGAVSASTERYVVIYETDEAFAINEQLLYGEPVKNTNITIFIEAGTYEEHYPIRVPDNVSLQGDELRRVIIKPRQGRSSSPWLEVAFKRDIQIDGLRTTDYDASVDYSNTGTLVGRSATPNATTGTVVFTLSGGSYPADLVGYYFVGNGGEGVVTKTTGSTFTVSLLNDVALNNLTAISPANWSLYEPLSFGYHYLSNAARDLYTKTIVSPGEFFNARKILSDNREFIQKEVVGFVNDTYPALVYDEELCERDVGLIIDAMCFDLEYGDFYRTLEAGNSYFENASGLIAITTQFVETAAAIAYANTLVLRVLARLPPLVSYQNIVSQITDYAFSSEAGYQTTVNDLFELLLDIIGQDVSINPPKQNDAVDVFLMNNATILRNFTCQGHGGFMCVLDPEGQVITKSPYMQTVGSFTKSINKQLFAGGMFVDGFSGDLMCSVVTRTSSTVLQVEGLDFRAPSTPCTFVVQGKRFQVDYVSGYNALLGTAQLNLNPATPDTNAYHGMGGPILTAGVELELITAGNRSMLANDFTQINDLGYGMIATNNGLIEAVSVFTYYNYVAYYSLNGGQIRSLNGSCGYGVYALKAEGADPNEVPDTVDLAFPMVQVAQAYTQVGAPNLTGDLAIFIDNYTYVPFNVSEVEVDHGGATGIVRYEVTSTTLGGTIPLGVVRLNLSSAGNNNTATSGIALTIPDNTPLTIRCNQNFQFNNVLDVNPTRPSTALQFANEGSVYRVLSYNISGLPANQAILTTRETYAYAQIISHSSAGTVAGSGQTGDSQVRILDLSGGDAANIVGKIFGWAGRLHTVTGYQSTAVTGQVYALLTFSTAGGGGLAATVDGSVRVITLRAGLPAAVTAEITVNISTMRATGHDLLDIGTGSFADTNYPNNIFGSPNNAANQANEVQEVNKGRVFYATTDQDGNFRIGEFFRVDQGTGTVTFAASIALSNLDGIGFKRGVTVAEFSTDDTMTDNATDTVPVEQAVRGYIDRRLGKTHSGGTTAGPIGPGFIPRDGSLAPTANIQMGSYRITNLSDPDAGSPQDAATKSYVDSVLTRAATNRNGVLTFTMVNDSTLDSGAIDMNGNRIKSMRDPIDGSDAATKQYVDAIVRTKDTIAELTDVAIASIAAGDVLRWNAATSRWNNGKIADANVSNTAAISQSKLSLADATAAASAGAAVKGIASFDSTNFDAASGYVSIKAGGVALSNLANIGNGTVIGNNSGISTAPSAITFDAIVAGGGALYNDMFLSNGAVVRTAPGSYGIVGYSSANTASNIVQRDSNGDFAARNIGVTQLNVGGNQALRTSGSSPTQSLELYTPQGGLALTITGGSGTISGIFSGTYTLSSGSRMQATYSADLAEYYEGDREYEVGTVLMLGGEKEVTLAKGTGTSAVVGVVSNNAAFEMYSACPGHKNLVALQGRVPCKVIGKISKGDMLIVSSIPGVAMAGHDPKVGSVIGKALENYDSDRIGTIEAVVGKH